MKVLFFPVVITCLLASCSNYYRAALASAPVTAGTIENLKSNKKYFILRDGNQVYAINNILFSEDRKTMNCTLDNLPPNVHRSHITTGAKGKMKYNKGTDTDDISVLNEVHFYINNNGNTTAGPYTLNLDQIQKVEILEKDIPKTKASHRTGVIIGVSSTVLVLGVIVAIAVASQAMIGF